MNEEHLHHLEPPARPAPLFLRRVSWGAIFAGLAVGMVTQIVLSLLGIAVGTSTVDPLRDPNPLSGYGTGAMIWFGIAALISAFVGACVAGRLSGGPREVDGMLHGVVTWSAATLLSVFLLTTALGTLVGGAATFLGRAFPSIAQSASQSGANVQQQLGSMLSQGAQQLSPTGREQSGTQAQTEQRTREAGATAAQNTSKAAWGAFALLLISAALAAWGGWIGTRGLSYIKAGAVTPAV